jgi:predicted nucleic acid-binding protein
VDICVDASLALMWMLRDRWENEARALAVQWANDRAHLVAPAIFRAEVTSLLREWVYRSDISTSDGRTLLKESFRWSVTVFPDNKELQLEAMSIAARFNHPKAYDSQYLALAQVFGCELWTGDRRLVNSLGGVLPWVHFVGEVSV